MGKFKGGENPFVLYTYKFHSENHFFKLRSFLAKLRIEKKVFRKTEIMNKNRFDAYKLTFFFIRYFFFEFFF